jgi:hypothetical protein
VGRAVAQRLGFQYADREILAEAARALHVETSDLEPLEERTASVWERIGTLFALGSPDTPFIPPTLPSVDESQLFNVEQQVIRSIASHGNAVIVGRGAAHILGDSTDILRVFLHAPLHDRITLAMSEYGLADRAAAEAVVRESDAGRAKFIKSISGRNWCDATLYDVALDTRVVGFDGVVDTLVDLARRPPAAPLSTGGPRPAGDRESR